MKLSLLKCRSLSMCNISHDVSVFLYFYVQSVKTNSQVIVIIVLLRFDSMVRFSLFYMFIRENCCNIKFDSDHSVLYIGRLVYKRAAGCRPDKRRSLLFTICIHYPHFAGRTTSSYWTFNHSYVQAFTKTKRILATFSRAIIYIVAFLSFGIV